MEIVAVPDKFGVHDVIEVGSQYFAFIGLLIIGFVMLTLLFLTNGFVGMLLGLGLFMILLPISYLLCYSNYDSMSTFFSIVVAVLMLCMILYLRNGNAVYLEVD